MFSLSSSHRYYLCAEACDMRKGFNGLSGIVTNELDANPLNGDVYVFLNKNRTRLKLLHWEDGGFVLYYKRLEQGSFSRPLHVNSEIKWSDLVLMVEGIEVKKTHQKKRYNLPKKMAQR